MSKIINQINNVIEEYVTEINKEFNIPRESLLGLWEKINQETQEEVKAVTPKKEAKPKKEVKPKKATTPKKEAKPKKAATPKKKLNQKRKSRNIAL